MKRNGLFASESVSEGHPDKLADRISDAVLDEFLRRDPNARVACETLLADQYVVVAGEFRVHNPAVVGEVPDLTPAIVRRVLTDTGYRSAETGIDPVHCHIDVRFNGQSADINQGVDREDGVLGAGDQGLMFGYACDETRAHASGDPICPPAGAAASRTAARWPTTVVTAGRGAAPHGGGAFSGKDPSKVDRSAAYIARFLAKQVVARGWATRCLTQIAYAIGVAEPVSFGVHTSGTGDREDEAIAAELRKEFDLRPAAIIEQFKLKRPIYYPTAAYGHFGREEFAWEKTLGGPSSGSHERELTQDLSADEY